MPRIISAGSALRKSRHKKDQARKRFARTTFGLVIVISVGESEFTGFPDVIAADNYGEFV